MKKTTLFVILVAIISFLSFMPATFRDAPNLDPIVGTWEIQYLSYHYADGTTEEENLSKCHHRVRHSYNLDGTLNYVFPNLDMETLECDYKNTEYWTGTWENLGEGKYRTNHIIQYPNSNASRYTDSTIVYTFSNKGKTLTKFTDNKKAGIVGDFANIAISELAIYKRIE